MWDWKPPSATSNMPPHSKMNLEMIGFALACHFSILAALVLDLFQIGHSNPPKAPLMIIFLLIICSLLWMPLACFSWAFLHSFWWCFSSRRRRTTGSSASARGAYSSGYSQSHVGLMIGISNRSSLSFLSTCHHSLSSSKLFESLGFLYSSLKTTTLLSFKYKCDLQLSSLFYFLFLQT